MKKANVLVWLPDDIKPTVAGEFTWDDRGVTIGRFSYHPEYLSHPKRIALDPVKLPLKRGEFTELNNKGIFGVMRDSGPDSWGRDFMENQLGQLDDFDFISLAGKDGVGAVGVGNPDVSEGYVTLDALDSASKVILKTTKLSADKTEIQIPLTSSTSLGGAKPKVTIRHREVLWIAKFAEKSDSKFQPHNEHTMLSMAKALGIEVAESFVHDLPHGQTILMSKRFDRITKSKGYARIPYASAHTVLGLSGNASLDSGRKSYIRLADLSRRWAGAHHSLLKSALFDRIVFNAMVSNIDDHPRNHGLLFNFEDNTWSMSPAFDIVAFPSAGNIALSMMITPKGSVVTKQSLLHCGKLLGVSEERASSRVSEMASFVSENWRPMLLANGVTETYADYLAPAFRLADEIASENTYNLGEGRSDVVKRSTP